METDAAALLNESCIDDTVEMLGVVVCSGLYQSMRSEHQKSYNTTRSELIAAGKLPVPNSELRESGDLPHLLVGCRLDEDTLADLAKRQEQLLEKSRAATETFMQGIETERDQRREESQRRRAGTVLGRISLFAHRAVSDLFTRGGTNRRRRVS